MDQDFVYTKPLPGNSRKGFTFILVVPSGFEPEQAEPKSAVLPLHHGTGKSAGKCIKKICPKKYVVGKRLLQLEELTRHSKSHQDFQTAL